MSKDGLFWPGDGHPVLSAGKPAPPLRRAIPIVFVPGIMGSNLQVKREAEAEVQRRFKEAGRAGDYTRQAWAVPNAKHAVPDLVNTLFTEMTVVLDAGAVKIGKQWQGYGPKFRQIMLNPETTEVDTMGFIPEELGKIDGRKGATVARERGWGSVHWDTYGDFLGFLQRTLNPLPDMPGNPGRGRMAFLKPFLALAQAYRIPPAVIPTELELEKATALSFPVYACGYNWTRSNLESAEDLLLNIEFWLKRLQQIDHLECSKVILVTHSMGGLVGRLASDLDKERNQRILGVIHGVQPATGAPLLYRRTVLGHEDSNLHLLFHDLKGIERQLLGRTPAETTPVIANAPGCLELLPSHLYPPGWLRVEREWGEGEVRVERSLPTRNDPYTEIYRKQHALWRLVDPDLLDPAGISSNKNSSPTITDKPWLNYLKRMDDVESLHRNHLTNTNYHANCFVFYGTGKKSFNAVVWRIPVKPATYNAHSPSNRKLSFSRATEGHLMPTPSGPALGFDELVHLQSQLPPAGPPVLMPPHGTGDGTVPDESGHAPHGKVRNICALRGVEHGGAFNPQSSRTYTILAICKIAGKGKN